MDRYEAWLWPDHTIYKRESRALREEHNALINAHDDLIDTLRAAVARVELANGEGDPILSAWLPEARAAIAKAEGRE